MGFNQVHCMDTLKAAIGADVKRNEFIYAFLDAQKAGKSKPVRRPRRAPALASRVEV